MSTYVCVFQTLCKERISGRPTLGGFNGSGHTDAVLELYFEVCGFFLRSDAKVVEAATRTREGGFSFTCVS